MSVHCSVVQSINNYIPVYYSCLLSNFFQAILMNSTESKQKLVIKEMVPTNKTIRNALILNSITDGFYDYCTFHNY